MSFRLVGREHKKTDTVVKVGSTQVGKEFVIIAGPCAMESREQFLSTTKAVRKAGAQILRGPVFKPRTSPYSFQGIGEEGIGFLMEAKEKTGMPMVAEIMEISHIKLLADCADMYQIGARNMHNFSLLKAAGKAGRPVLLKRGLSSTIEEWLMAAEYILKEGNPDVVLCERGIRTFETMTRNTLDISAIPLVKKLSHLPIIVDPSHAAGRQDIIPALCKAAIAAGADGLMLEVHPHPAEAKSDREQQLDFQQFAALMKELQPVVKFFREEDLG